MNRGVAKHKQMTAVRIALEHLLHLQRQAVKAAPHVGMAARQPHPCTRRDRDHRRRLPLAKLFSSADTVKRSTGPVIRIRPPPANSISMTPAGSAVGSVGAGDATTGSGKTATAENAVDETGAPVGTHSSCRQR